MVLMAKDHWASCYSYDPDLCHYGLVPDNDNNVAVCGSKPKCKTPEGIYDMAGNTWEWTSEGEGKMTLRGGGANISAGFARCNAQARAATSFSTYETGVRCCATAEEATKLIARGGRPNLQEILASLSNKVAEQKLQGFKVTPPDAGAPDLDGPDLQALDLPVPAKAEPDQKPAPSSPPGSPASKPAAVVLPRPVAAKPTPDLTQNRRPPPQADPSKRANVKPCSLRNVSCPSGLICCFNKSVCCLPPLTCKDNSVCSRGERCYKPHGRCYTTCDRIDKCRDPFSCDKVAKICRPPGPTCGQSDECPNNMICHPRRFYCVK